MKMDPCAMRVLQSLLVLALLPPAAPAPCPRPCSCPQPAELHCTFRSLVAIPAAHKHVERMNLGFNSINKIADTSLAGLRKLELLMVHGNDIHALPDGAFRDLASLQMLKMSYNKLTEINRHTLQGLWALARLHLDHNRLEFIHPDAFQGLTSLRLLQLEGNQLQQLHPATFTTFTLMNHFHLSTVRHLHLSDNGLSSLPSRLLATMPQLENLYLHGNPWTCDCDMRWLHDWDKSSPGVLKCKKDRALPGGQLCPMCSSPKHLQKKELQALQDLVCSGPVISSPHRTSPPEDNESEVMVRDSFREPFGNISLGLSDEHGNEVNLDCSVGEPKEISRFSWEQVDQLQLASNITLSVDLECPVDREKYEHLWRLIAYYSNVPAHLQRGILLSNEPHPTYVYRQDSEKDALYYTGVKVNLMARPAWLMQASADLQLNRLQSSAKAVRLILSTQLSETLEAELVQRQRRTWVFIESTNKTQKVWSALLGSRSQMFCNVHGSGRPVIRWMLPDGSEVEAPYGSPDDRLHASSDGQLLIKSVRHTDTGIYYCIAKVDGDLDALSFHLTVQESSSPLPGEDASVAATEAFVGNPVSLPCTASGSPDPEINWILPSNSVVSFRANSSRASVHSDGTLHIPHTQVSDSGDYKCVAVNQHGVDTLAAKINVVRRKGLVRPLRKVVARPQSASGVNTQIKVPTDDAGETSGDIDVPQEASPMNRQDPLRRRIPEGVAPGRRGGHPSRSVWRRPQVLRKPVGARIEEKKNIIENRRRINVTKSKIDPEKWADILAKIRDRNTPNTVTTPPAPHAAEDGRTELTTQAQETIEGSSDGVTAPEREGQDYLTTPHAPVPHTQAESIERGAQGPGSTATSESDPRSSDRPRGATPSHQRPRTPHAAAETTDDAQRTTQGASLDPYTTSSSVFFLPQTTSVPLHAVTLWQANTNSASSSSSTFSLQENHSTNTDVEGVQTADWSEASERSGNTDRLKVPASANDERELSLSGSQIIPSVQPNELETGQEENGKYLRETATTPLPHTRPRDTALDYVESQAMLTTASLTTALLPPAARGGPEEQLPPRPRPPNSRRRKGGRRNRPSRRKQNLSEPTPFIATTPANAPLATDGTTSPTRLKIEPLQVTTASFNTAVPFAGGQTASSGRLSHTGSAVSSQDEETATKPSPSPAKAEDGPPPSAKPPLRGASVAPAFPTASPGVGDGQTGPQSASRILEDASPPEIQSEETSPTRAADSTTSPGQPPETQTASAAGDVAPEPSSDSPAATVQTDVEDNQSGYQFSMPPSQSASTASTIERDIESTSAFTSPTPSRVSEEDLEAEQVPTKTLTPPESYSDSSAQSTTETEPPDLLLEEEENIGIIVDASTTSKTRAAPSPDTESVMAATEESHETPPGPSSTGTITTGPPMKSTTQETPWTAVHHSRDHQTEPFYTTSEPARTSDHSPSTYPPARTPTSPALKLTSVQTAPAAPTTTAVRTTPFSERPPTSTQQASRVLPGPASTPRGKPRIMKSNLQTIIVKAETHARLPCEAEGEPKPFLSWTKVSSGASIAQNTRVQRFEVHPNGTLIIRNAQQMDGGQYLCMVQNQYGADKMLVNLVVLPQPPRVLQPRSRDISVNLGARVDLDCQAEGHPVPRVTWVLPDHAHTAAAASRRQHVAVLGNGTLRISQASYADRGIYKCIGSSAAGVDSVTVHLHVAVLPPVIQQAQHENATLPEGSSVHFHCTATGSPPPVIRWVTPDGMQLTTTQVFTRPNLVVFPNGTLYIGRLGPENAGRYQCSASNEVASSWRTVILTTRRNPSSSKAAITSSSPQRTDVIYGSKLLLDCVATGKPDPWIIWRTPSKKLVDAQYSFDPRIKVFHNGTITVRSVTVEDSGDYMCVARNKLGDDYVLLRVNVLTRPAKIEQKQQRSSQEVVYGGPLKVDCVASGLPDPAISWALPDGTMVNPVKQRDRVGGGRSRRYLVFDNGTLYFNDVGMPEEGDYTCYAENQLGKDEMKVRVKVKGGTSPPQIQGKDQKMVRVFYGETIRLSCNAKGEPHPHKTWISPTHKVISPDLDKYLVLDDGTLVVQKVQRFDGGKYTCIARNSAGQDHRVTRVEVLLTPPMINGLRESTSAVKVTAVQDQRKLVDCAAKGTPAPRVMWVLPGNMILPAPYHGNRMSVHPNGTLEIRSPKRTDAGDLVCIARNEGGEVRLVVSLDVKEAAERPQIRSPPTDSLSLTDGNAMALNCSFEGSTLPHVTWILPSGTPLQSGGRFSKFFHRPDGSLIISNPSVGEAGTYRCLGRNSGGLVESVITLSPGRKPEIHNKYNSPVSVTHGETLLLHCLTDGEQLRLTWTLPSGVVLNTPQRAGRYSALHNGTLAIQQATVYDRGSYVCRAANEYGSSQLPVSVTVIGYPPQITNGPPPVTHAKRGVAVQMNCAATGLPRAEVAWETPDKTRLAVSAQPRVFGNKYLHPQGSLIIQNPTQRDAGAYRCTARNALGVNARVTVLSVF